MNANPTHGAGLWPMVLEKAVAKYIGTYNKCAGGNPLWALTTFLGPAPMKAYRFSKRKSTWRKLRMKNQLNVKKFGGRSPRPKWIRLKGKKNRCSSTKLFKKLCALTNANHVLAAGGVKKTRANNRKSSSWDGLISNHAYSILDVAEPKAGVRLVKVRNPHGRTEWKGDWSDGSKLWRDHPKIARDLEHETKDDGAFWMSWGDFSKVRCGSCVH